LGDDAPAGKLYDEALVLAGRAAAPAEDVDRPRLQEVALLSDRSSWHGFNGRLSAAEADLDAALARLERLPATSDARRLETRRFHRAVALLDRASVRGNRGRLEGARVDALESVALWQAIAEKPGARSIDRVLQIIAELNASRILARAGDSARAAALLEAGVAHARSLYRFRSFDPTVYAIMAQANDEKARRLHETGGDLAEAAELARTAIVHRTTLSNLYGDIPHYRLNMISSRVLRGRIRLAQGATAEARQTAVEALRMLQAVPERLRRRPDFLSLAADGLSFQAEVARALGQTKAAEVSRAQAIGMLEQALERDPERFADRQALRELLLESNRVFAQ
jgi:tetratricopeptide (TPR) repeat protein